MSKLSLNKSKKKEIPPTQDAFKDPIDTEDFDPSPPLTNISAAPKKEEDKTESDFSDVKFPQPDLLNRDYSKELVEIWTTKLKETKTTLLTESVKFLDNKIFEMT
ncbi:Hypothetical predicted protein [Mytilus galloprovincialis]|uniref:Uncharacterized protein n=1 Tax=Mytilus galloprovincialis TaxID=29158 RepID=A0A8B6HE61_MYTGA|nr:Hypothetical predicted protein [Mytilus galloprovincialis]